MGSLFKGIGRTNHCVIEYNGICYRQIDEDRVLTEEDWNNSPATTGFDIYNDCECECVLTTTAAPTSPFPTTTTSGPTTSTSSTSSPEATSTTSAPTTIPPTSTTSGPTTTTCDPCDEVGPSPMAPLSVNEALESESVFTEGQLRNFVVLTQGSQFIKCMPEDNRYAWFQYYGPTVPMPEYPPTLTWDLAYVDNWSVAWFPEDCQCGLGPTTTTIESTTTTTVCCPEDSDTIISIEDFGCEFIEFSQLKDLKRHLIEGEIVRHDNVLYTFNPSPPATALPNGALIRPSWEVYSDSLQFSQYHPDYNDELTLCCHLATTTSTIAPTTTTASYCDQVGGLDSDIEFRRTNQNPQNFISPFGGPDWSVPPCDFEDHIGGLY